MILKEKKKLGFLSPQLHGSSITESIFLLANTPSEGDLLQQIKTVLGGGNGNSGKLGENNDFKTEFI